MQLKPSLSSNDVRRGDMLILRLCSRREGCGIALSILMLDFGWLTSEMTVYSSLIQLQHPAMTVQTVEEVGDRGAERKYGMF